MGDGFGAVESAGRIEVRALFAGVEFKTTLRTFGGGVSLRLQYGSALGTAGNRPPARHLNGAGAESVLARRPLPLLLFGSMFLAAVLIAVLAVFCYDVLCMRIVYLPCPCLQAICNLCSQCYHQHR